MIWSGSTELNRRWSMMIISWSHGAGVFRGREARGGKAGDKK